LACYSHFMRFFNTAGPINPEEHYFVSGRLNFKEVLSLIERKQFFVLHAPRQSGKTTAIQEFIRKLNSLGKYAAVYVNVESAQAARDKVEKALLTIIEALKYAIEEYLGDEEATVAYFDAIIKERQPTLNALKLSLGFWAKHS